VPPPQPLGQQDLVDPAAAHRDPHVLLEVGAQAVERPAPEGQPQLLWVGQRGGDDLGDLLGRVDGGPAGSGHVLQSVGPLGVEPPDPGGGHGAGDVQLAGDGGGPQPGGRPEHDVGPLDDAGLGGAGAGQGVDGPALLGGQPPE
jgi:hypothetical protein